jgi:hypothetical protein
MFYNIDMSPSENISMVLAKRFLADAPEHMIESQAKEFKKLSPRQLQAFTEISSFPIPRKKREVLIKIVGNVPVERLEKRIEIAASIIKAREEGIYEIEEHKTGMLKL